MSPHPPRIRLGVIVPSSNTALEPLTQQMVAAIPRAIAHVTVHFARFRVTKIELSDESTAQFALEPMLEAARLLADAKVDMIGWSGTSASWLGLASDEALCRAIEDITAIPATSSVLAMYAILSKMPSPETGLLTPYLPEVNLAIANTLAATGLPIEEAKSRCAGLSTNFDFASLSEEQLDNMMQEIVENGAKTVLIVCTNVGAAHRAVLWEQKHKITVLDSVATVLLGMLHHLEVEYSHLADDWGSIFKITI
ncbi:hypothetical protein NQ176_g3166 [Zarea fungicola]|uniref:Uncharacterized protein n=1 Tax=Zarea fungicola TaxID=93591 RepID=A0ACC1NMD7_9HYPO|nr:hypothetical protein NQ176_g3166 [Lecanicillium fungicola]